MKILETMMLGKHFDTRFVEIKRHVPNREINVDYEIVQQNKRITTALLLDIKTIQVKELDNSMSFIAFGVDNVIGKEMLKWGFLRDDTKIDILTFQNNCFYVRN